MSANPEQSNAPAGATEHSFAPSAGSALLSADQWGELGREAMRLRIEATKQSAFGWAEGHLRTAEACFAHEKELRSIAQNSGVEPMKRSFKIVYTCPALFGKQEFLCRAASAEDALAMFHKEVDDWVKITQVIESYKDAKGENIESGYDVSFTNHELKK